MPKQKTLLATGAHFDDCVYGLPGTMIKALRMHYRVVILALIGDYENWPPAKGRSARFVKEAVEICHSYGAEMRFLDFASGKFELNEKSKKAVAEVVAEAQPDIAFHLWPEDHHPDHVAAAAICRAAFHLGGRILDRDGFRPPARVYAYDNGPRHTIGFVPDTFVNVTDEWQDAIEWLGKFGALQADRPFDPVKGEANQRGKEVIAAYRGATCGVKLAEAFWGANKRAAEIL